MTRLGNTVGTRINEFDTFVSQTVYTFNELFPECPIRLDVEGETEVTILGPEGNNCREILVGTEIIKHKMYSDILYTLDRADYYLDERDVELSEINGVPV